jgi:cysteine desulfurase
VLLENYFDNAATTPLDRRVLEAMFPFLRDHWGNAHSLHSEGSLAMEAVATARRQVANLLGADDPGEVVFTSGATESNNWILRSIPDVSVSPFEHSSLYEPASTLGLGVLRNSGLHVEPNASRLNSLMKVNNEIGTIFSPESLTSAQVHSDVTQAAGKIPLDVKPLDFASFSAHKFYGPKGVGGLYAREGSFPAPLLIGGDQETGIRAGTLNVPGIVGMGAAAEIALERQPEEYRAAAEMREIVLEQVRKLGDARINGGTLVSPFILSISCLGVEGETVVIEMDRMGFAMSAGSACSSRSSDPSHVLVALGLEEEWLRGTVRISFGRFNTNESSAAMAKKLVETVESLRTLAV